MKGMEALFKMVGVNPDEIKTQVDNAAKNFQSVVDHFNKRLDILETKIDQINSVAHFLPNTKEE